MDLKLLETTLNNEPKYRFKQAQKAVFSDLVESWKDVTSLPLNLREKLEKKVPLAVEGEIHESRDNKTFKAVIELKDGLKIEAVLMRHSGRNSVCLSSQVGCPLGCGFCATGQMGFKRNLTSDEIVEQFLYLARYLKNNFKEDNKITNVIYMGMGEPFLNYDNVMSSVKIINDKDLIGLGARHISISTAGIVEGIGKMANEKLQINLAISLHAPIDKLRSSLMPINKKYSIKKVLMAVDRYIEKTGRRVMFEYLMIKGVNDTPAMANELAPLVRMPLYLVNLIPYNPTERFKPSSPETMKKFKATLEKEGVAVTQRYSFGKDIKAACGQLAGK